VIIFDASYLVVLMHPNPAPAKDRENKPVSQFRERVAHLTSTMDVSNNSIGVPTPAMAEVLVRSGAARAKYVSVLSNTWRFQILPFDSRAAIEAAELVATIKSNNEKWDTWAKVKFDIQIVAIAKAEAATVIYSDDTDIEKFAKRFKIRVIRICDLPLPPPETEAEIDTSPIGSQSLLPLAPTEPTPEQIAGQEILPPEVKEEGAIAEARPSSPAEDAERAAGAEKNNQLQADATHPAPVQASDSGRAQGEAAGNATVEAAEVIPVEKPKPTDEGGPAESGS
jgi:hypothetical protein